jgi:hypothetical protein
MPMLWSHQSAIGLGVDFLEVFGLPNGRKRPAQAACLHPALLDDIGVLKAFCLPNLKFCRCNNRRVSLCEAFRTPENLTHRAVVTFTHQKNGNNGEKRTFVRNKMNPSLCFVAYFQTIHQPGRSGSNLHPTCHLSCGCR